MFMVPIPPAAYSMYQVANNGYSAPRAIPQQESYSPLYRAAQAGNEQQVLKLIKEAVNINNIEQNGNTALHIAAANGHIEIIRILIINGADVEMGNGNRQLARDLISPMQHVQYDNIILNIQVIANTLHEVSDIYDHLPYMPYDVCHLIAEMAVGNSNIWITDNTNHSESNCCCSIM